MTQYRYETRNVLKGGQIKFQGERWTAPGLTRFYNYQARLKVPLGVDWSDPHATGPQVVVARETFQLVRVNAPPPPPAPDLDALWRAYNVAAARVESYTRSDPQANAQTEEYQQLNDAARAAWDAYYQARYGKPAGTAETRDSGSPR